MAVSVRDAAREDEAFILALNAACEPAVGPMDAPLFRRIGAAAHRVLVAELDRRRLGFLILLRPGAAYESDNYAWFEDRFDRHLYVDRIAIDAAARGQGVGRALYGAAFAIAAANGDQRLTAEVNEAPPNPESMKFHAACGFRFLLSRPTRSGKIVAMLERPLDPA